MNLPKPSPALILFLLSPAIGELLSGSAPPVEFFNPFGFVILVSLYGSGAVIIRELKVCWKKGISSVLLLGAAYGILEEGLLVCSFYNPNWSDLNQLAVYGRWFDVNWIWTVMLTIYHAVYSITIPITLVELAYSQHQHENWVSKRILKILLVLLLSVVVLGFFLFNPLSGYLPPLPHYLLTVLVMILFGYAAYRFPGEWGSHGNKPLPKVVLMWMIGVVGTLSFFLGFWLMPTLMPLWPIGTLFGPALILLYIVLLRSYEWKEPTEKHRFALVSGALAFFIVFAPLQELDTTRTDDTAGMSLVGLSFLVGLILLGRHIWSASSKELRDTVAYA